MRLTILAPVVLVLAWAGALRAQPIFVDYTWNNPSGGSYNTASNWTPSSGFGGIPDSGNEGAVFNLPEEYLVRLSSDISTNSAVVRDGVVGLALGTVANPRRYTLNSLTVAPTAGGGDPRLSVGVGTLRATTIRVAGGGRLDLDPDAVNFDNGTATVTGAGSTWSQNTGFLRVGELGDGTLLVEDGGRVANDDGAAIGRFAGSDGKATVTGEGSSLEVTANIAVGQEGTGTLIVEDGGSVSSTTGRVAATSSDSVGMVTITGEDSHWTLSNELRVGESGEGTLVIEAGGSVSSAPDEFGAFSGIIGGNVGSTGTVTVTGAGSTWTNSGPLFVGGFGGTGTLVIEAGGSVSSLGGSIHGMATVTGTGSTLTTTSDSLSVRSNGTLSIEASGSVSSTSGSIVGDISTAVTITGANSTWTMSEELRVGNVATSSGAGDGILTIAAGGSVFSTDGFIGGGGDTHSTGTVIVAGDTSTWTNNGNLVVNESRLSTGELTIEAGGSVSSTNGFIARRGGNGMVTVTGAGSTWMIDGHLSIGGDAETGSNGGTGTLTIDPGATVDVAQDTVLFPDGLLRLQGGTLTSTEISFEGGGQFEWTDGTLHVDTFDGDLTNESGTLAPGRSAGETTITGDYTHQAGATLEIEIGGLSPATEHDHVTVNGNLLLGGGELRLSLLDGFVPDVLHTFTILEFAGDIFGQFDNVAGGERLDTADGLGSFVVHYGPTSIFNPNQIVLTSFEPSATIPGDYNGDGTVDAADYVVWRDSINTPEAYDTWRANFGATATGAGAVALSKTNAAVPEPGNLLRLCAAAMLLIGARRDQSSRR